LKKDPDDLVLVREVGRALVMTHDYNRAIRYYENTLRDDPKLFDLRNDLAELYIKLKAYDDSKRVLIDALKSIKDYKQDLEIKQKNVNTLMLLQKVYLEEDMQSPDWKFKENESAKQTLMQASKTQADVIELCKDLAADKLEDAKELAAEILFKLGMYYEERDGSNEYALQNFNDALKKNNQHLKAMVAIARIAQNSGDNDQCMTYCQKIIQIEPSNEEATYMLANLMLMRDQPDQATDTYIKLLEKDPDNFRILSNLIILLKRAGKIQDALKFIEKAELKTQRSKMAGLHYCKGLFNRYNSEP
jgi:tetratricopeptide repeat protein 21B